MTRELQYRLDRIEGLVCHVLRRMSGQRVIDEWLKWFEANTPAPVSMTEAAKLKESPMKLTPRQNELVSEALASIAESLVLNEKPLDALPDIRRKLVAELSLVTAETDLDPPSLAAGIRG